MLLLLLLLLYMGCVGHINFHVSDEWFLNWQNACWLLFQTHVKAVKRVTTCWTVTSAVISTMSIQNATSLNVPITKPTSTLAVTAPRMTSMGMVSAPTWTLTTNVVTLHPRKGITKQPDQRRGQFLLGLSPRMWLQSTQGKGPLSWSTTWIGTA